MNNMEYDEVALGGAIQEEAGTGSAESHLETGPQGEYGPAHDGAAQTGSALDSDGGIGEGAAEQADNGQPAGESPPAPGMEEETGETIQEPQPAEKPKRKRAVRKKAAELSAEGENSDTAAEKEPAPGGVLEGGEAEQTAEDAEESGEIQDIDTAAFVLEEGETAGQAASEDAHDGNPSDEGAAPPAPDSEASPASKVQSPRRASSTKKTGQASKEQFARRPLNDKPSLLSLDLNKLDEGLTEEEREEWNAIYASYRSKSILTGRIMGIDSHSFTVRSRETGQITRRRMLCAVIINYRAKVLIPETEMWLPEQEKPSHVLRNMSGAEIDYTILDVDREGGVAIGSRRMAVLAQRHFFDSVKGGRKLGERLTCRVLAVGPKRCLVECGGRDMGLTQKDLTYTSTPDLRERYHPGQTLNCILKEYNRQTGQLWISVKETTVNPFFGAVKRHPIGSRRQAVISGKYAGGVFCTLPDETVCLCLYSTRHSDSDFHIGDTVILAIKKFDYDRQLIYGIILSKW